MRSLWLLSLLLLSGCYYPYGSYYGYGRYPYSPAYPYGHAPGYYQPGAEYPYYTGQAPSPTAQQRNYNTAPQGYGTSAASDPNNCGTPDEPKSCTVR